MGPLSRSWTPIIGRPVIRQQIEHIYRTESRRVLATLIRLLGDFELAEEALHEAFAAALTKWEDEGIPKNPRPWLISTGRFKAIDQLRRRARFDASVSELALRLESEAYEEIDPDAASIEDDRLRLIFTCCHPSLSVEAQIALTLREVCGLRTEEVARAFLVRPSTVAQRIVRAKAKIRDARIPYEVPGDADLPERLGVVLHVVYLVFNEGYAASEGEALIRRDLTKEAIHLGRLLCRLLSDPEARGLLALMLLQDSRRDARVDASGDLIRLNHQDRALWDRDQIREGVALVRDVFSDGEVGPFTLQAAIAAAHAEASTPEATDWPRIVRLYDLLREAVSSPVVELNRAVAIAERDGPEAALPIVDALLADGKLKDYHLAHATRADLCRRMGRTAEARAAYEQALALSSQTPERRFLERRIAELPE